jgi:hypothetical protein
MVVGGDDQAVLSGHRKSKLQKSALKYSQYRFALTKAKCLFQREVEMVRLVPNKLAHLHNLQ